MLFCIFCNALNPPLLDTRNNIYTFVPLWIDDILYGWWVSECVSVWESECVSEVEADHFSLHLHCTDCKNKSYQTLSTVKEEELLQLWISQYPHTKLTTPLLHYCTALLLCSPLWRTQDTDKTRVLTCTVEKNKWSVIPIMYTIVYYYPTPLLTHSLRRTLLTLNTTRSHTLHGPNRHCLPTVINAKNL
jgi:hypothetical protein